jgi:hypothetical protein
METLALLLLVTMLRNNTGEVGVSMELLRLRLPSNDGLQSNTSQYYPPTYVLVLLMISFLHTFPFSPFVLYGPAHLSLLLTTQYM